jgi:hypothetical protein
MKLRRLFALVIALSAVVVSQPAFAQSGSTGSSASVKSACAIGSLRPIGILLRQKIISQYTAAGHKNVFVSITAKSGRKQSQSLTFSNIQGITGVNVAADGSTVSIGTNSTPISLRCSVELPVVIKVSYVPAGTATARKTVTSTQTMVFDGFFR